ncbi:MAG: hypothetical protein C4522_12555 [Desulfobacteraceae bacterium]|nr:MAG: hypothetical protein C4522_12555 [Desulfobacteraceae bacterium]
MDIDELFEGIAVAFRQYQQEITEQAKASVNPTLTGLESVKKVEKTVTVIGIEQNFPKIA